MKLKKSRITALPTSTKARRSAAICAAVLDIVLERVTLLELCALRYCDKMTSPSDCDAEQNGYARNVPYI
jgi:hypothetical protein